MSAIVSSILLQVFCFTTVIWFIVWLVKRRHLRALAGKIQSCSFRCYPVIGHAYKFFGDAEDRMEVFKVAGRDALNTELGVCKFWLVSRLFLVVADPVIADRVLKSCLQKDELMEIMQDVTGNGLIFAKAAVWRPRRRVLAPVFRRINLSQFTQVFAREAAVLIRKLGDRCGVGDFTAWKYLTTYTMDSVCETGLGVHVGAQENESHPFLVSFETSLRILATRVTSTWLHPKLIYQLTPMYRTARWAGDIQSEFIDQIIQKKRKELKVENNHNHIKQEDKIIVDKPIKSFLEMMLSTPGGSQYSDVVLREETLVIAMAGTDTSAVASCFTLSLLAQYPEVQEEVFKELEEVFGDSDRPITNDDYSRLRYLEAVMKESLRLYPPVPVIVRTAEGYVPITSDINLVPNTGILINIAAIHRNPKYWGDDADDFKPERFFKPLTHPAAFLPFSHGPRNCLGYHYALMSMKAALSGVLRMYKILPVCSDTYPPAKYPDRHGFRLKFDIMMKDAHEFPMSLERRQRA